MKQILVPLMFLLIAGCGTTGKRTDITIRIDVEAQGNVAISPLIDQESLTGDVKDLTTSHDTAVPVDLVLTPMQSLEKAVQGVADTAILKKAEEITDTTLEDAFEDPVIKAEEIKVLPVESNITEEARFHGINSDNGRPVWYFKQTMKEYPEAFNITIPGCGVLIVTGNNGTRIDYDKNFKRVRQELGSGLGGTFVAQSEVAGRGMVVVGSKACKSKRAYIPAITKIYETYDVDMYEDGRARYLFRGSMETMPKHLTIRFKGVDLFQLVREGDRWEGPDGAVLKNSHGRANSITFLLPKDLSSNPQRSDVIISGR